MRSTQRALYIVTSSVAGNLAGLDELNVMLRSRWSDGGTARVIGQNSQIHHRAFGWLDRGTSSGRSDSLQRRLV